MDNFILSFDRVLRTLAGVGDSARPVPGDGLVGEHPDRGERDRVAALMRVNHSGEVCAQALYQGQAVMARSPEVKAALGDSAREEVEHLAWTLTRIKELGGRTSVLDPFWFLGSFAIGAMAAACGDRWSLAFLEETERQVVRHLQGHLAQIPDHDQRTRAILEQMIADEDRHAALAKSIGAAQMPTILRELMRASSAVMTKTAYRI